MKHKESHTLTVVQGGNESLSCALQVKTILWDAALLGASDVTEMATFLDFTPISEIVRKRLKLNIFDVR